MKHPGPQVKRSFDVTAVLKSLIEHICASCPEFAHIQVDRTIVAYMTTRVAGTEGVYASVQPLRFKGGAKTVEKNGRTWAMPEVRVRGKEILYVIYFALPRFLNLSFEDKLTTIFHELYHISPDFNGDLRRFPGRNYAHGHSRKAYNMRLQPLIKRYLQSPGAEQATAFLRLTHPELEQKYGTLFGTKLKRTPKPVPV